MRKTEDKLCSLDDDDHDHEKGRKKRDAHFLEIYKCFGWRKPKFYTRNAFISHEFIFLSVAPWIWDEVKWILSSVLLKVKKMMIKVLKGLDGTISRKSAFSLFKVDAKARRRGYNVRKVLQALKTYIMQFLLSLSFSQVILKIELEVCALSLPNVHTLLTHPLLVVLPFLFGFRKSPIVWFDTWA